MLLFCCCINCSEESILLSLFNIRTNLRAPIIIGTIPSNPIRYVEIISGKKKPNALTAISKPIPMYWPKITCLTGNMDKEEKNIISKKISSMLVAIKAVTPIATRLMISVKALN